MSKITTLDPKTTLHKSDLAMQIGCRQVLIRNKFYILQSRSFILKFFESILKLLILIIF